MGNLGDRGFRKGHKERKMDKRTRGILGPEAED